MSDATRGHGAAGASAGIGGSRAPRAAQWAHRTEPVDVTLRVPGAKGELVSTRDISHDADTLLAVAREAAVFESVVAANTDGILAFDLDGFVTVFNAAASDMYGYSPEEIIGEPPTIIVPASEAADFADGIEGALSGRTTTAVQRRVRKDGVIITVRVVFQPLRDGSGNVIGGCLRTRDVTKEAETESALGFHQSLLQAIMDGMPSALSVRDADFNILMVNKAAAALAGTTEGELLGRPDSAILDPNDIPRLRLGDQRVLDGEVVADEIAVTLAGTERILARSRFPVSLGDGRGKAIATITTDVTERRRAEIATAERAAWEEHIASAVRAGRLLAYSQPIVDIASMAQVEEELLVRMKGSDAPDRIVLPGDFLPQAEKYGLMTMIDRFMLIKAVELAEAGRRVSVNMSATSLLDSDFTNAVVARLTAAGKAAANITIEVTETAALGALGIARDLGERLSELGAGLALDDFGTGYGSLAELRELRIRAIKIDRSFVSELHERDKDRQVVRAVVAIAEEFGLTTVAEGVETAEVLEILRGLGVDRAQGFLFARPGPVRL